MIPTWHTTLEMDERMADALVEHLTERGASARKAERKYPGEKHAARRARLRERAFLCELAISRINEGRPT